MNMDLNHIKDLWPANQIWLEVQNIRLRTTSPAPPPDASINAANSGPKIDVQLRGDKDNRWWETNAPESACKTFFDAMDKKRPLHACLTIVDDKLKVGEVAVMFAEPQR